MLKWQKGQLKMTKALRYSLVITQYERSAKGQFIKIEPSWFESSQKGMSLTLSHTVMGSKSN